MKKNKAHPNYVQFYTFGNVYKYATKTKSPLLIRIFGFIHWIKSKVPFLSKMKSVIKFLYERLLYFPYISVIIILNKGRCNWTIKRLIYYGESLGIIILEVFRATIDSTSNNIFFKKIINIIVFKTIICPYSIIPRWLYYLVLAFKNFNN